MPTTDINIINVNGLDYPIKDQEARKIAEDAMSVFAYKEDGYTASQDYPVIGTPICWKGELYYTTIAITEGALFVVGTNLRTGEKAGPKIATIEDELTANGNRIYMDYKNGKYGYNTSPSRGADTFFPFRSAEIYTEDQTFSYTFGPDGGSQYWNNVNTSKTGYLFIGAGIISHSSSWDWHRSGGATVSYNRTNSTMTVYLEVGAAYNRNDQPCSCTVRKFYVPD